MLSLDVPIPWPCRDGGTPMFERIIDFLFSAFIYPDLGLNWIFLGILLSITFGAFWLLLYRPPVFRHRWLWGVAGLSAILTWISIAVIQIPLQSLFGELIIGWLGAAFVMRWLLITGIPQILLSGLVQEASKLVPVIIWRRKVNKILDPKMGLVIGAAAGAGFGVFESVWALNSTFLAGWDLNTLQIVGVTAFAPFWERFFAVGFHIAVSALAGYGLAKGLGWQFYLLASALHGLLNYSVVLLQMRILNSLQVEIYIAALTCVLAAVIIRLRWANPTPPDGELEPHVDIPAVCEAKAAETAPPVATDQKESR